MTIPEIDALLTKLREQYPNIPDHVWQERREFMVLDARHQALRVRLCELAGYHHHDGSIPVEKIKALIEETSK